MDPLQSFKVEMRGDDVVLHFDPAKISSTNVSVPSVCAASLSHQAKDQHVCIVVGGGAAGACAIDALRLNGFNGRIILISSESYAAIDRTKLSKTLGIKPEKLALRSVDDLVKMDVELHLGKTVTAVDFDHQTVTVGDAEHILHYDYLVLATGGTPRKLPIQGADLERVFVLRTSGDAAAIDQGIYRHFITFL